MDFKLILEGFIVGVGKIIPGVSGSMLAIFMGIYEELIEAITNFFRDKKKYFKLLFNFGIGLFLAIFLFSHIILFFLKNYYFGTMYLFLGLIAGTVVKFAKKTTVSRKDIGLFLIPWLLFLGFSCFKWQGAISLIDNGWQYVYIIILGGIDAFTSIVPGISGTSIFMILGSYELVLSILANPVSLSFLLYAIGLVLGVVATSYLMAYFFKHWSRQVYVIILSLAVLSLVMLCSEVISGFTIIYGIIFFMGIALGYKFDK